MRLLPILVVVLALAGTAQAFWGKGHLLVARIAYDILYKNDRAVLEQVDQILKYLQETDAAWTKKEGDHAFVECATFADDIKNKGGRYQQGWHFIDIPYLDQGGKMSDYNFTYDTHNITQAIGGITAWFNQEDGYEDQYAVQQILAHRYNCTLEQCGLSTAMRLLIHYCGDIHQPLHCTSRVNPQYPKGDFGGNTVPLADNPKYPKSGVTELHALWDAILYDVAGYQDLPFSAADWESYGRRATQLMKQYPLEAAVANDLNPVHWAQESYDISKTFVYKGIKEGMVVPDSYVSQGKAFAEKQIVKGGNRLANLLRTFPLQDWIDRAERGEGMIVKQELLRLIPQDYVRQELLRVEKKA